VRGGVFLEPKVANGMDLEWDLSRARGLAAEGERRWSWNRRSGAARLLAFLNTAPMGDYGAAVASATPPEVTATRQEGRMKFGFVASANQELGSGLAAFARASWNDGHTETWAFTEADRSLAIGAAQSGALWGRDADEAGAGPVISGLSGPHRRYLEAGGLGFILGDAGLRYGPEALAEIYYRASVTKEISAGVNYQPIVDPGFNRDRGPAHVFTGRMHVAF